MIDDMARAEHEVRIVGVPQAEVDRHGDYSIMRNRAVDRPDNSASILTYPEMTPYSAPFNMPPVPHDWAAFIQFVLTLPGMNERDAATLRGWLTWRTLPRRFWQRTLDMAARAPCAVSYTDWLL